MSRPRPGDFAGADLAYLKRRARPLPKKTVTVMQGTPKRKQTITLYAGVCPCAECGHGGGTMNHCEAANDGRGCECCKGTCT